MSKFVKDRKWGKGFNRRSIAHDLELGATGVDKRTKGAQEEKEAGLRQSFALGTLAKCPCYVFKLKK